MKTKNTDKAKFCKSLGWALDIEWLDRTGIHRLDEDRLAKVELQTRGTYEVYPGFQVSIISKTAGKVDSKYFRFDDYLSRKLEDRTDGRRDYPLGSNTCYHVSAHCGFEWYIAVPKSTEPFTVAVLTYIESFR